MLDEFGAYPAVIQREPDRYLPFLATTDVLIAAVRAGVGRETAHEVIKEHAVAVALAMREKGAGAGPFDRVGRRCNGRCWTALRWMRRWPTSPSYRRGRRPGGMRWPRRTELVSRYPDAAKYTPGAILLIGADLTDLDNFAAGFPHELFARHRAPAPVFWHEM